MELPKRKHTRLKGYDYSEPGAYFITICTHGRKKLLSHIIVGQGLAPAAVRLTPYGQVAQEQLLALEQRFSCMKVEHYVIMPNHIHAMIRFSHDAAGASPRPTLPDVVRVYKSMTTRLCNRIDPLPKLFQSSFYDHVIRGEQDYKDIWDYISNNPAKWAQDRFYAD